MQIVVYTLPSGRAKTHTLYSKIQNKYVFGGSKFYTLPTTHLIEDQTREIIKLAAATLGRCLGPRGSAKGNMCHCWKKWGARKVFLKTFLKIFRAPLRTAVFWKLGTVTLLKFMNNIKKMMLILSRRHFFKSFWVLRCGCPKSASKKVQKRNLGHPDF